ncbi:hypothetical protein DCCM_3153 [Desulfocucumis palustris]|uniref:N-acetyltransferase domain-containing protein n=1 Tax=Desulfocucumis palustris TaxID=1898651 RepID=A0A2L2XD37_9FIRM|nr:hypothetical protein [Desulfocucumis palustris]GBF34042.1 hypothetical protein DCCM_3153 [Desulfocucumis palustris]
MSLEILEVANHRQLTEFCLFPKKIYSPGEYPVATGDPGKIFNPEQNPVMHHLKGCCFMAFRNGRAVGRVAAIKDLLNPDQETGFFSCFECEKDPGAASGLLEKAYQWLETNGCTKMLGPATFNTNQQVGILVEGFERGYQPMMPYNPPYYPELMEAAGLEKLTDLLSFHWWREMGVPEKVSSALQRVREIPGVTLRRINSAGPGRDMELVRQVYNLSMSENWGFIPLTRAEAGAMLNYCARFADPDLLLALMVNNKPAGILLFTPSPLPSRPGVKSVRGAIIGIIPAFRHKGLDSLMMAEAINILNRKGYHEADLSQVHEENKVMLKIITKVLKAEQTRRFRIYRNKA